MTVIKNAACTGKGASSVRKAPYESINRNDVYVKLNVPVAVSVASPTHGSHKTKHLYVNPGLSAARLR